MPAVGIRRRKIELLLENVDQLPTLPGLAHHVLSVATADHPRRRDLQMAVEVDPALAAKALKLAVDLGCPARDLLSLEAVFDAVPLPALVAEMLSTQTADPDLIEQVELPRLWRHTLAVAMAAQVTATRVGTVSPETALLCALLHDIGQVALRVLIPHGYEQVLQHLAATGEDLLEAERNILGVDHAVLGKRLAQQMGFPELFQNVIWLHHQARVPEGARPGIGSLTQVIRLADLLARQHGFSYYEAEPITDNPAEVAERLGLSGVQAEHIGRQIASAFDLNADPVGFNTTPPDAHLQTVYRNASARLGRLLRSQQRQVQQAHAASAPAHRLVEFNASLAALNTPRQVMEHIAHATTAAMNCRVVVPYLLAREGGYVEGLRYTAARGVEDHFLYDLDSCEDLAPPAGPPSTAAPVRAERTEQWLFDRHGPELGAGPFYSVPMTVAGARVGGIVFSRTEAPELPTDDEATCLADLACLAGLALRRAQAEADLVDFSEELADANRRLEAAYRTSLQQENVASLIAMATGAAHEINNPLAIISGRAQQLAADESDPDRHKALETVIQQAHRISEIIAELRTFAKPPAPQPADVDPVGLAHDVAKAEQPDDPSGTATVQVIGPEQAPCIHVDRDQIAGALGEVVRNGIQACTESGGGAVRIRVERLPADAALRFVVTDDGPGMSSDVQARAFDPFYSGHDAGRRRGLGLSKAYRAIQINGGQMALESQHGHGTTVRITVPTTSAASEATDAAESNANAEAPEASGPSRPTSDGPP